MAPGGHLVRRLSGLCPYCSRRLALSSNLLATLC
jgi:hypothetical protein